MPTPRVLGPSGLRARPLPCVRPRAQRAAGGTREGGGRQQQQSRGYGRGRSRRRRYWCSVSAQRGLQLVRGLAVTPALNRVAQIRVVRRPAFSATE